MELRQVQQLQVTAASMRVRKLSPICPTWNLGSRFRRVMRERRVKNSPVERETRLMPAPKAELPSDVLQRLLAFALAEVIS